MTERIKNYILSQVANHNLSIDEAKSLLLDLPEKKNSQRMDIGIIGMSGRFSKASNVEEFWELLKIKENCIRDYPDTRKKDIEHLIGNPHYSEFIFGRSIKKEDVPNVHSKSGYLDEIDKFDSQFFGIPPNEALYMDPQHRMALQLAWEAMEDAGYGGDALIGSRTGIYLGKEGTNVSFYRYAQETNPMQLTGSWESLMISRISYLFDFKGPCMMVDTACSAGLVSIHLAVQALAAGDCQQAIAGGINLSIIGELKPSFEAINLGEVEATDGLIRTFDAMAQGTAWGEGIGMVLLKPLQQAIKDGDNIYAVIKGSAINNDGHSNSITAPNAETQEDVILSAWKKAGIDPETITYIEAHGTGTILGDPIEVKGISNAFKRFTKRRQFCAIGSLKTNMGHMVGASGVASLIKVVKSIEHKELAPIINFESPNPYINFVDSPLYVNTTLTPWITEDGPRRAALSSFGFSRTNCHMVVEEPPAEIIYEAKKPYYFLTISGKNQEVLDEYIRKYNKFFRVNDRWTLADLCYTSNIGRGHYEYRTIIIAENKEDLKNSIEELINGRNTDGKNLKVFQGYYQIVSEKKKHLETGEITRQQINTLSKELLEKLIGFIEDGSTDRSRLEEICNLYIQGADINWKLFYKDEKRKRISQPVYPLQRKRFWANPKISKVKGYQVEALHPLVEQKLPFSKEQVIYTTSMSIDKHWVLSDHKISNKSVLPGTSYLEMVRFAAAKELGQEFLEFKDIFFLTPLVVEENEDVIIYLSLLPISGSKGYKFSISSITNSGESIYHVEGKVLSLPTNSKRDLIDVNSIKDGVENIFNYKFTGTDSKVFTFGPHWDTVRTVWYKGTEALAKLQLLEKLQHEVDVYKLHPSLLDNAVNLTSQETGETFLPFMYKSMRVYGPMTKEMYTYVRIQPNKSSKGETMTYDVDIVDNEGRILVEVRDYTVKKVHDISLLNPDNVPGSCLKMNWIPREDIDHQKRDMKFDDSWAVIITPGSRGDALIDAMAVLGIKGIPYYLKLEEGTKLANTFPPDNNGFDAILTDAEQHGVKGILFATDFSINHQEIDSLSKDIQLFNNHRKIGVDACFKLCKLLLSKKYKKIKNLKVLVRDAWYVDGSENSFAPLSSATAALAKVIGQEYLHLNVDVLEVSGDLPPQDIAKESFFNQGIRAIRESGVFIEELQPYTITLTEELPLQNEGVYIITGGLGGIGLSIADSLANKGKVNIILLGRSLLASVDQWERLSELGSSKVKEKYVRLISLKSRLKSLEYISLDVADSTDVAKLAEDIEKRYGSIAGIFHAAGVAGDGFLMLKDYAEFKKVLDPKVNGSMNLLNHLVKEDTGFLFLFSSITALTGGEGQGDYCAANAFLDSLAEMARLKGVKATAVNWPSWKEVGMAVDFDAKEDDSLFSAIGLKDGLKWIEYFATSPHRRVIPATLNNKLANELMEYLPFRLSPKIIHPYAVDNEVASGKDIQLTDVRVKGVAEATRTQVLLANAFGHLLGLNEVDVYTSFQDMGGNSLMTTQLLGIIEGYFPGIVDISDIFSYPSVQDLSEVIDERRIDETPIIVSENEEEKLQDGSLLSLIEEELEGTEFLEEFMNEISGGGEDDN